MKKILFILCAALTFATISNAQGGRRGGMNPQEMIQQLKDSLKLSDVQVDSVKAIFKEFLSKQMELRQNQDQSREDRFAKMKELNDARNARLKAVFTDEQYKKFQEMEERRREQMRGGRERGRK